MQAHFELKAEVVTAGDSLDHQIVNSGTRSVGYGTGIDVQWLDDGDWITVSHAGWHTLTRREVSLGETGPRMPLALTAALVSGPVPTGRERPRPFEWQALQPLIPLIAEFSVAEEETRTAQCAKPPPPSRLSGRGPAACCLFRLSDCLTTNLRAVGGVSVRAWEGYGSGGIVDRAPLRERFAPGCESCRPARVVSCTRDAGALGSEVVASGVGGGGCPATTRRKGGACGWAVKVGPSC